MVGHHHVDGIFGSSLLHVATGAILRRSFMLRQMAAPAYRRITRLGPVRIVAGSALQLAGALKETFRFHQPVGRVVDRDSLVRSWVDEIEIKLVVAERLRGTVR